MVDIASTTEPILSTEDWSFQCTAANSDGTPFDMSSYSLRASFRLSGLGTLLDDCTVANGDIVLGQDPSVATITSYASSRTWVASVDTNVVCDVMIYRTNGQQQTTHGVGRLIFKILAGVTHG